MKKAFDQCRNECICKGPKCKAVVKKCFNQNVPRKTAGQPTMNTFPGKKQHGSGSGRKLKKRRPTF